MIRIPYEDLRDRLRLVLAALGFEEGRAALCARLFAETSLDGVHSHGLNRFPRFVEQVRKGYVDKDAEPALAQASGAWECWDGRRGPGNLNAWASMGRAIGLARGSGMGCVALRDTNHWMRGGTYGIQAAEAGCVGIAWTNTLPNLPSWGARGCNVGNNPLVLAVPHPGCHLVLDMAMSQFSYGRMELAASRGEELPVDGGLDEEGRLTRDPAAILGTRRPLPIGFWKGSGLSFLLDTIGALLSGGSTVGEVGRREAETGLTQVFIAFDLGKAPAAAGVRETVARAIEDFRSVEPEREGGELRYPGERAKAAREENLRLGVPVDEAAWEAVGAMPGAVRA